jgi:chromosome segregation ATPase
VSLEKETQRYTSAENCFKQEIQTLSEQLTAKTSDIATLEANLAELGAQAQDLTNTNGDLASKLGDLDAKLADTSKMNEDLLKLKNELEELNHLRQQDLDVMKNKFDAESKSLLEKVNLIGELENRVNSEREVYSSEKGNWTAQLNELNQQLESSSSTNEQLRIDLTNERSHAAGLQQQINQWTEKCQAW